MLDNLRRRYDVIREHVLLDELVVVLNIRGSAD
jgi:hypothetical protein